MTSRRAFLGFVVLGAVLILAAGGQAWVRGRTADPVLGSGPVEALGSAAAPGALALALVAAAAAVGLLTGGTAARRVCAVILALAALAIAGVIAMVAGDPVGTLGRQAAASAGRTGVVVVTAERAPGLWLAALGSSLVLVSAVIGAVGARGWSGLGARYDAPAPAGDARGAVRTAWDDLSEGVDPTTSQP